MVSLLLGKHKCVKYRSKPEPCPLTVNELDFVFLFSRKWYNFNLFHYVSFGEVWHIKLKNSLTHCTCINIKSIAISFPSDSSSKVFEGKKTIKKWAGKRHFLDWMLNWWCSAPEDEILAPVSLVNQHQPKFKLRKYWLPLTGTTVLPGRLRARL